MNNIVCEQNLSGIFQFSKYRVKIIQTTLRNKVKKKIDGSPRNYKI